MNNNGKGPKAAADENMKKGAEKNGMKHENGAKGEKKNGKGKMAECGCKYF